MEKGEMEISEVRGTHSLHASRTPLVSMSVVKSEYSHWTAAILATLDARRRVSAEHSDLIERNKKAETDSARKSVWRD